MQSAVVVLETVLSVLVVMGLGALLGRCGVIGQDASAAMARIVADVAFPALCFQGLARADAATLSSGATLVGLGFATLAIASAVGLVLVRVMRVDEPSRATAVFAIAIGNWIFLPLPVASALYGESGTTVVILNNVGAQVFLWTVGVAILAGGKRDAKTARAIAMSPGLWATLAGVAVMVFAPGTASIPVLSDAIDWIASMTIPLVSIAIGAQLAVRSEIASEKRGTLLVVIGGRLLLAPLIVSLVLEGLLRTRVLSLPHDVRMTEHLIAAMPVSLSAAALVQRHGGDTQLVSRAVLVTTLLSVVTAPVWFAALETLAL